MPKFIFSNSAQSDFNALSNADERRLSLVLTKSHSCHKIILRSFEEYWSLRKSWRKQRYFRRFGIRWRESGSCVLVSCDPWHLEDAINHLNYSDFWVGMKFNMLLFNQIQLQSLNAYVSTLGGGYFLCGILDKAKEMAERQLVLASKLGNLDLAGQCRLHYVYNLVRKGQLETAKELLRPLFRFAVAINSPNLKRMVKAAWLYTRRLSHIKHKLLAPALSPTEPFVRQRFIS